MEISLERNVAFEEFMASLKEMREAQRETDRQMQQKNTWRNGDSDIG